MFAIAKIASTITATQAPIVRHGWRALADASVLVDSIMSPFRSRRGLHRCGEATSDSSHSERSRLLTASLAMTLTLAVRRAAPHRPTGATCELQLQVETVRSKQAARRE